MPLLLQPDGLRQSWRGVVPANLDRDYVQQSLMPPLPDGIKRAWRSNKPGTFLNGASTIYCSHLAALVAYQNDWAQLQSEKTNLSKDMWQEVGDNNVLGLHASDRPCGHPH